jgi:hypothetical protein
MDEHLPGVSTRRDGRSSPTTEYSQTARRTVEYVGAGGRRDGGVQATGRPIWRGVLPAATEQRGEGEGDLRPDCRVCVFSHRQSGPVPAFLSSGVPERAPRDWGWPGLAGWIKTQIRGKRGTGGATRPFFAVRMKKPAARGLAGLMAGDALTDGLRR